MTVYIRNPYNRMGLNTSSGVHNYAASIYQLISTNKALDNTIVSIGGLGTGVFISANLVITADHVLSAAAKNNRNDIAYGQLDATTDAFAQNTTFSSSSLGSNIGKITPQTNPFSGNDVGYLKTSTSFSGPQQFAGLLATGAGTVDDATAILAAAEIEGYPTPTTTGSDGSVNQVLFSDSNQASPITRTGLYRSTVDAESSGAGTWNDNNLVAGAGNSGGPLLVSYNDNEYIAGLFNYANATGPKRAKNDASNASIGAGGVLFTSSMVASLTKAAQDADANGKKSGWWNTQPTNIFLTSDDTSESVQTNDRTDSVIAGAAAVDVIGSLGDDNISGNINGLTSVRYSSKIADSALVSTALAEISHVDVTLDLGYGYGNMDAEVYDNLTEPGVSDQTLTAVGTVALSGHNDTVYLTTSANPQVATAGNDVPIPPAGNPGIALTVLAGAGSSFQQEALDLTELNEPDPTTGAITPVTIDLTGTSTSLSPSFTLQLEAAQSDSSEGSEATPVTFSGFMSMQMGVEQTLKLDSSMLQQPLSIKGYSDNTQSPADGTANLDSVNFSSVDSALAVTDGQIANSSLTLSAIETLIGSDLQNSFQIGSSTFSADAGSVIDRYIGGAGVNNFDVDYGQPEGDGSAPSGFDYGSGGTTPLLLEGGSGSNNFDFTNNNNATMTVVYGGSGQNVYNFEDDASIEVLHIANFDPNELSSVDMKALAEQLDTGNGYDASGETSFQSPRVVIINPTGNDEIEFQGKVIGSVSDQVTGEQTFSSHNGSQDEKDYGFMTGSQDFGAVFFGEALETRSQPGDGLPFGPNGSTYFGAAGFSALGDQQVISGNGQMTTYYPNADGSTFLGSSLGIENFQPGDFGIEVSGDGPSFTYVQSGDQPFQQQGVETLAGGFFSDYQEPATNLNSAQLAPIQIGQDDASGASSLQRMIGAMASMASPVASSSAGNMGSDQNSTPTLLAAAHQ